MFRKINEFLGPRKEDVWVFVVIVLVALFAFGLGRLSVLYGQEKLEIIYPNGEQSASALHSNPEGYVASRSGSAYYFPWCGTAQRIKPANLVHFDTEEEAKRAGYRAGNCSGM